MPIVCVCVLVCVLVSLHKAGVLVMFKSYYNVHIGAEIRHVPHISFLIQQNITQETKATWTLKKKIPMEEGSWWLTGLKF